MFLWVCLLGMLAKKKSLIFCLLKTGGGRGGGKIKIVFINPKMSDFFPKLKNKGKNQDCLHLTKNELFFLNKKKRKISKSSQKFHIGLYLMEFYHSADLSISEKKAHAVKITLIFLRWAAVVRGQCFRGMWTCEKEWA